MQVHQAWWESTLAGVVVGGLITLFGAVVVEVSRLWREKRQTDEESRARLRVAARLVHDELDEILSLLIMSVKNDRWWTSMDRVLPTDNWIKYRETLAASLRDPETWEAVQGAYMAANDLNWAAKLMAPASYPSVPRDAAPVRGAFSIVSEALERLADFADLRTATVRWKVTEAELWPETN